MDIPLPVFNYMTTVLSQYANSPILLQLISNYCECIDQTANFDAFYNNIWNIDTAQGYGLDVWGRIVGVNRVLQVTSATYFGFQEADDPSEVGFNQAPFYAGQAVISNYPLSDSAYRTLIFAKALSNISDGSIKSINQLLLNLFPGRGNCYVTDGRNMTMTYTFKFQPTPVEIAIIQESGVLPKPAGVSATVVIDA